MKKYFAFDDEPITGWQFFGRTIVGGFGLLLFVVPGLWFWAATGYKRAGAFGWSSNVRVACAIAVVVGQVMGLLLQADDGQGDLIMTPTFLIYMACCIVHTVMFYKNGNKPDLQ